MFSFVKRLSTSAWYWRLLILAGVGFESVGLFYQYILDYGPCPLCIHVRIGVLGFILISLVALLMKKLIWWRISHLLNTLIMAWLSERAYILLGTERGFVFIECGVDSGLPSWLPLDQWFPVVFGVWESCGYTPKLFSGVSMAETLMVLFPMMLLISLILLIVSIFSSSDHK